MKPSNELNREQAQLLLKAHGIFHEARLRAKSRPSTRSKYNNTKVEVNTFFGVHRFDSKKESHTYRDLAWQLTAGHIVLLLCQVPFRLPGKTKYVADFLVLNKGGGFRVIDVKGFKTDTYRLKKRQVEEIYGFKILEI